MASANPSDRRLAKITLEGLSQILRPRPRGTSRSYRRFALLGHQRSGSTLIVATLNRHPNVVCFSEAFNRFEAQLFVAGLPATSKTLRRLRELAPRTFVDRFIYTGYADAVRAVGFKAMADQLDQASSGPVLRRLFDDPEFAIIRITRRNKLAAALSLHNAQQTGEWHVAQSSATPTTPITRLDPSFCEDTMTLFEAHDAILDRLLADRPHLRLEYEDLIEAPDDHFRAVQEHLGVEPLSIPAPSRKQQTRPLQEAIENYDALAAAFAGTRFERFFETRG